MALEQEQIVRGDQDDAPRRREAEELRDDAVQAERDDPRQRGPIAPHHRPQDRRDGVLVEGGGDLRRVVLGERRLGREVLGRAPEGAEVGEGAALARPSPEPDLNSSQH